MSTKKGTTKAEAKAASSKTIVPASKVVNPYRETSKKAKAFEIYKKGGERAALIAAIKKCGVTDASACTWFYFFRDVVKTGKQRDWETKRKAKATKAK